LKLKFTEEKVKILENNNKSFSTIAENNSKTSCSALNFVIKHYSNAPHIQEFNDYQLLLEGNEEHSIAEVVLHKHQRKELVSFIGNVLIKKYKTDNPEDQTMWTSDTVRLAYMIHELTGDNELEWLTDKGGIKTANYTVKPILLHIKEDVTRLVDENRQTLLDLEYDELNSPKADELRKNILAGSDILQIIAKGELSKEVIKYISSHFSLDRKKKQKKLTHEKNEKQD
jgi:hypothetical protein